MDPVVASGSAFTPKYSNDVLDRHDKEAIVALEVDWNGTLWIKKNAIVLRDRPVIICSNLQAHRYDSARKRRNFDLVWQMDAGLGLLSRLVLPQQDPQSEWFNDF
jgi:hypothetical protein